MWVAVSNSSVLDQRAGHWVLSASITQLWHLKEGPFGGWLDWISSDGGTHDQFVVTLYEVP